MCSHSLGTITSIRRYSWQFQRGCSLVLSTLGTRSLPLGVGSPCRYGIEQHSTGAGWWLLGKFGNPFLHAPFPSHAYIILSFLHGENLSTNSRVFSYQKSLHWRKSRWTRMLVANCINPGCCYCTNDPIKPLIINLIKLLH